jgi:hypothetical protein
MYLILLLLCTATNVCVCVNAGWEASYLWASSKGRSRGEKGDAHAEGRA